MENGSIFYAGAAKGNITPEKELFPMPYIGPIVIDRAEDSIYVRVLAMEDGKNKSLFITFDLCAIPYPEETLKMISEGTGIPEAYIFMAATHTHEVPLLGFGLYQQGTEEEKKCQLWYGVMKDVILETVRTAMGHLKPARIGYGTGKSYINVNRDETKDGKTDLGNNFERPSDKTLYLVRIEDMQGSTIALLVNYAVHAVVMNGCMVNGGIGLCGDLPGRTSAKLEEQLGGVALWTSGAAGDQNPRIMTAYGIELKDGKPKMRCLEEKGYMILDFLVEEHVRDILKVNEGLVCEETDAPLFAASETIKCPGRKNPEKNTGTDDVPDAPYILRLLTIGDIAFEGISAEVVTTVGQAVREDSPYRKTILVTHASAYCGYVPDDWEYEHDAFEAKSTPVAQGAAQPAFLQGFRELFRRRRQGGGETK